MERDIKHEPFADFYKEHPGSTFPHVEALDIIRERKCTPCTNEDKVLYELNNDDGKWEPFTTDQTVVSVSSWVETTIKPIQSKTIYTCMRCGNIQVVTEKVT